MITASTVPSRERSDFYPSMTTRYVLFEQMMYRFADLFLEEYSGAYWEFITLSNGARFAYPKSTRR